MPYVLHDFLPVDVDVHLAPRPILLGLAIGVWVALLFAMRPLVALRRVSPLQALRREPDADALRRARWDPLRIALSLAIAASVLALGLSRANTPRRGIGFTLAIAGAIGILWLSAAGAVVGGAAVAASVVAVPAASGDREPLPSGQSDARRRARARIRRVPHGHAVPGAAQHSAVARPAPRRSARERRVLRRAGEPASRDRFDHPRGARGADRRDADRRRCGSRRSTESRRPRSPTRSTRIVVVAIQRASPPGVDAAAAARAAKSCAIDAGRGRCGANSARPSATR